MSEDTERKPRRPLLVNLAWATALVVVLAVGYVLSYSPVYRWKYGESFHFSNAMPRWNPIPVYRPVDLLMDHTPLREPLLSWAGLFGVREDFEWGRVRNSIWSTKP